MLTMVTTPHGIQAWEPESAADLAHFHSIPWCAAILSRPGVRPYRNSLPGGPAGRGCDPLLGGFMARGTDGVLRHASLLAEPGVFPDLDRDRDRDSRNGEGTTASSSSPPSSSREHQQQHANSNNSNTSSGNPFSQHLDLYTLGPALHGVPRTLHGGVLCMLLDASCGRAGFMHRGRDGDGDGDDPGEMGAYTSYTNTRFLRPGVMDGDGGTLTVLVRTQVSARLSLMLGDGKRRGGKGREKMTVLGSVEGEGGKVFAVAESEIVEKAWKQMVML
ncbi:hypothetical protein F5X99DRAFT_94948 [Biscogniauxia marginata]|nr:hypothetical protein F5X99DRAFT_94948 [Biscogniauxia marginata]